MGERSFSVATQSRRKDGCGSLTVLFIQLAESGKPTLTSKMFLRNENQKKPYRPQVVPSSSFRQSAHAQEVATPPSCSLPSEQWFSKPIARFVCRRRDVPSSG